MYRTARQKHDAGWNRAVWHIPKMKYALAKALNGEEVVEEECIEEEAGLDVDEAGDAVYGHLWSRCLRPGQAQ